MSTLRSTKRFHRTVTSSELNMVDHPLLKLLQEARGLLLLPENDFSWSSWASSEDAVSEMDSIIASVAVGSIPRAQIGVVFAPSGPMQELSLSSGWAQRFVDLAERVDAALGPSEQT
jgi:hypothetical protein